MLPPPHRTDSAAGKLRGKLRQELQARRRIGTAVCHAAVHASWCSFANLATSIRMERMIESFQVG